MGQQRHSVTCEHASDRRTMQAQVIRDPVRTPSTCEPQRDDPPLGASRNLVGEVAGRQLRSVNGSPARYRSAHALLSQASTGIGPQHAVTANPDRQRGQQDDDALPASTVR